MEPRWTIDILLALVAPLFLGGFIFSLAPQVFTSCEYCSKITSRTRKVSVSQARAHSLHIEDENSSVIGLVKMSAPSASLLTKQFENHCIMIRQDVASDSCSTKVEHIIKAGHWYGGPQYYTARWPINKQPIKYQAFVTNDLLAQPNNYGSILERYWLSTTGLAIYVINDDEDLHYGVSKEGIILGSKQSLEYIICRALSSVKDTHVYMASTFLKKAAQLPDQLIMKYPVWSTWVRYKTQINQSIIISFAKEIHSHGFKASQIEIDDTYTSNYGDMVFDLNRFPNPHQMLKELKEMNYRVTSWVHPFVNINSKAFEEGTERGFLVKDRDRDAVGLMKWWQGVGAVVDFFNSEAQEWYMTRLRNLQSYGIDSFKFDGGEYIYMPADMQHNPNLLTKRYVQMAAKFGGMTETRAAYRNQDSGIYLRMMDKHSCWGFDNGLKSMIPSALHLSIIGYHFILPDMIGGNAMVNDEELFDKVSILPEKELYIRWFQLVTFLQSMQISISPWQYDEETTEIALALTKLRETYLAPIILSLAKEVVKSGEPIIRPMWWHSETDPNAYEIEDQFMLGPSLLIAPVIERGVSSRWIYFPDGLWFDLNDSSMTFQGPQWFEYPVDLKTVPYFKLIE
ncbi:myogenesis-regulating glycosidase-like [Watersipora subatra]|uniref:myogenesis-regulating glycosidase-like n=1 Tax=Watersipora subatra TaxID=2589382 RepID=UPI00355B2468